MFTKGIRIALLNFSTLFFFNQCSVSMCDVVYTENEQTSEDGVVRFAIGANNSSVRLKITNISSKEIVIDKEMEFLINVTVYDRDERKVTPDFIYDRDIHKNSRVVKSCVADNGNKAYFRDRFIILKPGESICNIFRNGKLVYDYLYVLSFDGASSITRYCWEFLPISDISRIEVTYDGNSWNAPVVDILANQYEEVVPREFFRGNVKVHWKNPANN